MQAGQLYAKDELGLEKEQVKGRVVSSYGPYTSIDGTATKTGVAGLTAEAKLSAVPTWRLEPSTRRSGL